MCRHARQKQHAWKSALAVAKIIGIDSVMLLSGSLIIIVLSCIECIKSTDDARPHLLNLTPSFFQIGLLSVSLLLGRSLASQLLLISQSVSGPWMIQTE